MEPDYAYPTTAMQAQANLNQPDRPPLVGITDAADELQRIAGYIQAFIDRCRGGVNALGDGSAKAQILPVPSGHLGQLDRLRENLHRVDCLARELQTIG